MVALFRMATAVLLLQAVGVHAAQAPSPTRPPAPGVYKHDFPNGDVSGDSFKSENILEVTAYRPGVDYVRLHKDFYNGHVCDIWGMVRVMPSALLYSGPKDSKGQPCRLTLQQAADGVHIFEDQNGACRNETCGERGGYGYHATDPVDFKPSEYGVIHYMPRLLASREYKAAVAEYEGRPAAP